MYFVKEHKLVCQDYLIDNMAEILMKQYGIIEVSLIEGEEIVGLCSNGEKLIVKTSLNRFFISTDLRPEFIDLIEIDEKEILGQSS